MIKIINLEENIYVLCTNFPEIKDILKNLGFENITNPLMLRTTGKLMTLKKAAQMKNINIDTITEKLKENDFEII
jgi:hypothetical protein